ncbi:hypothetical protein [Nitrosomonas sp. Nm33]|uniref:hypothetical protein n=1 Tax=Nitrosomonas sp. Nm33 TaxID=133724 RepID=UPI000AB0C731|nr:hypothetical protein [Nitrosomonas sp. Nm33]
MYRLLGPGLELLIHSDEKGRLFPLFASAASNKTSGKPSSEFINEDELVEVTPQSSLRKKLLTKN